MKRYKNAKSTQIFKNGHFKGARVTITEAMCKELMEEYHEQFEEEEKEFICPICGDKHSMEI